MRREAKRTRLAVKSGSGSHWKTIEPSRSPCSTALKIQNGQRQNFICRDHTQAKWVRWWWAILPLPSLIYTYWLWWQSWNVVSLTSFLSLSPSLSLFAFHSVQKPKIKKKKRCWNKTIQLELKPCPKQNCVKMLQKQSNNHRTSCGFARLWSVYVKAIKCVRLLATRPTDRNRQKKDQAATHSTASWRILAKRSPRNITHFRILRPWHGGYRICQPHLQSLHRFCFTVGWANRRSIHFASAKSDSSLRARSRFEVNFEAVERESLLQARYQGLTVQLYEHTNTPQETQPSSTLWRLALDLLFCFVCILCRSATIDRIVCELVAYAKLISCYQICSKIEVHFYAWKAIFQFSSVERWR